jgi:hypothetical protein
MTAILDAIRVNFPSEYGLIQPIFKINKKDILEDQIITASYNHIKSLKKIGSQYQWMAACCIQLGWNEIEICFEKDLNESNDSYYDFVYTYFDFNKKNQFQQTLTSLITNETATINLFKYYHFQLTELTKSDMLQMAIENNWMDIMKLTWFCHKPNRGNPCGKCNPCLRVTAEGLGFRIPILNRLKGHFKICKKKVKVYIESQRD